MRCFVFPGQGSQQSGMGTAYVDDVAWQLVVEASDLTGRDVGHLDAAAHIAAGDWAGLTAAQLTSPVRWTASVNTLLGLGADTFVELGPGAVLVGTIKGIDRTTTRHQAMTSDEVTIVADALGAPS